MNDIASRSAARERRGVLSLHFATGERPDAEGVEQALARECDGPVAARVSHRSKQGNWVELLSSGLTFDLAGLAPGASAKMVEPAFRFGFAEGRLPTSTECLVLGPGAHIASGATLTPVLRAMLGLAADLALRLPVVGIGWGPAQTLMEPRYFARLVLNWLGGGAFPALGLTAIVTAPDGSVASRGLAHFTGQEIQLEGRVGEQPADAVKLAIRVIDLMVREGRLRQPRKLEIEGATLHLEPSQFANQIWGWREG